VRQACITLVGLVMATLLGCSANSGPAGVTTVVFDGQTQTINGPVTCTTQPDGDLIIFAAEGGHRTVRVSLRRDRHLVVEKVGVRIGDVSGYSDDSGDMWAIKVDDAYTINGRMPPNVGERTWHDFTIDVRCRQEVEASYEQPGPRIGAP
jgi:Mycobacterium 19 kDa lipoprotein antigen